MKFKDVKVKLACDIASEEFWRATYNSDFGTGVELVKGIEYMKKEYLNGKLYENDCLEVEVPIKSFNKIKGIIEEDVINYGYVNSMKDIWEIAYDG